MRRIHGYVLVKESNQGIPNLVVCAYDSETTLQEVIGERPRANVLTPLFMEKLGKRIGSVLTDREGAFQLTRDDLQFEGVESRPDLLLLVLAPEDVVDPKRPFVTPPEQRLLYISSVPRTDAGAEEAFIIRLLQAQLDASGIPLNSEPTGAQRRLVATNQLLQDLESNAVIRGALKTQLHPRLKEQYVKNVSFRKQVRDSVKLSALPRALRDHPLRLEDPMDLEKLQKQVVNDGLKRLKDYEPQLRLRLTPAQLRSTGLKVGKRGAVTGKINTLKLADTMRTLLGGVTLVRKDDFAPSSLSPRALDARYSVPSAAPRAPNKSKAGKRGQSRKKSVARKRRR